MKYNSRYDDSSILIPTAIFCDRNLSFSEALVEYLWIEHRLTPSRIGKLLTMDRRNVYTIMQRLSRKRERFPPSKKPIDNLFLPVSVFIDRKRTVLESAVVALSSQNLTNAAIALLLNRSEKTIWTVLDRSERGDSK